LNRFLKLYSQNIALNIILKLRLKLYPKILSLKFFRKPEL